MPQITPPRMPKMVSPSSMSPVDVAAAMGTMEKDILDALVREPLAAMGVNLPALPAPPGSLLAQALTQVGLGNSSKTVVGQEQPRAVKAAPATQRIKIGG